MNYPGWRTSIDNYPVIKTLPLRFGDMDYNAHVNNVAIYQLYDEARTEINLQNYPKEQQINSDIKIYLVDVHIALLGEVHYPGEVTVATGVLTVGTTSYTYGQAMFQNHHCVGLCETVTVYAKNGKGHPLPEHLVEWLTNHRIREK
jgi:acyl-CoA thioester hydrolase